MLSDTLNVLKFRRNFYRDAYYRALSFLLWSFLVILVLLLLLIVLILSRPESAYYATSSQGQITLLNGLAAPNYSNVPLIP